MLNSYFLVWVVPVKADQKVIGKTQKGYHGNRF